MREMLDATEKRLQIQKLSELPALPFPSESLFRIFSFSYETTSVDELIDIIKLCPGLSARIVGLANAAYYHGNHRVSTVADAIVRVGLKVVKGLTLGILLSSPFKPDKVTNFPLRQYWYEATMTATCASRLAARQATGNAHLPEEAYLGGLLHNLGLLILAHVFPTEMAAVFANEPCAGDLTLVQKERALLCVDHHKAAAWILHKWHLPKSLVTLVEHYHEPAYRGPDWELSLLVGLCSRWVLKNFEGIDDVDRDTDTLSALSITATTVEALGAECQQQSEKLRELADILSRDSWSK